MGVDTLYYLCRVDENEPRVGIFLEESEHWNLQTYRAFYEGIDSLPT